MHFQSPSQNVANCMQLNDKSEFTQLLHKVFEPQSEEPNGQMKVIDATAFVNIYQPKTLKTFGQHRDDELVKVLYSFPEELIWILFLAGI